MDFSSIPRALESLQRREPPLSKAVLEPAQVIGDCIASVATTATTLEEDTTTTTAVEDTFANAVTTLLLTASAVTTTEETAASPSSGNGNKKEQRWEGLAVGLKIATEALEQSITRCLSTTSTTLAVPSKAVYMEGPRVPAVRPFSENDDDNNNKNDEQAPFSYNNNNNNAVTGVTAPNTSSSITNSTPDAIAMSTSVATALPVLHVAHSLRLCRTLHATCLQHLEHKEPRVRTLVAKAVGAYSQCSRLLELQWEQAQEQAQSTAAEGDDLQSLFEIMKESRMEMHRRLLDSIHEHIVEGRKHALVAGIHDNPKHDLSATTTTTTTPESSTTDTKEEGQEEHYSRSSTGALDDTTGWRALETNWHCLAALVFAMGPHYFPLAAAAATDKDDDGTTTTLPSTLVADCQYSAVTHVNRHVRAAAMAVLEQWIVAARQDAAYHGMLLPAGTLRTLTLTVLEKGLADNWSQVRMAASVLCRVLWQTLEQLESNSSSDDKDDDKKTKDTMDDLYPILLPRMALNRFYMAQGVKLYTQETWKLIFATGSALPRVVQHLPAVVRYYTKMCDADNHAVREAACQAIAELATRFGESQDYHDALIPQLPVLLQALLMCFFDESWPVRDEACLACGILCKSYPNACKPELKTLWERWTEQLTDSIWSVRQDAAVALADALLAYKQELMPDILQLIHKLLPSAKQQSAMTPAEYKARQNDAAAHTGAQLYSCGSLAPKLRKGGAGRIGCGNCEISRPKAPWEATDGCIYLIKEVIAVTANATDDTLRLTDQEHFVPILTQLADVCRVQHFPQADELRTTLWRQLPAMAAALGRDRFKRYYLELFLDLLFRNLESRSASQLSIHAAQQCCQELAELVGVNIFRGRLEDYQRDVFDQVLRERQQQQLRGGGGGMGPVEVSPFGPPVTRMGGMHPAAAH